jgi:hypothetical protein
MLEKTMKAIMMKIAMIMMKKMTMIQPLQQPIAASQSEYLLIILGRTV